MLACAAAALVAASGGAATTSTPLDPTFAQRGVATLSVGGHTLHGFGGAVDSDGRPIVVGDSFAANADEDLLTARLRLDGSLDSTFGDGGEVVTDVYGQHEEEQAQTAAVEPDGKILVGGLRVAPGSDAYFAVVARYDADGSLDTSFATNGIFTVSYPLLPEQQEVTAIAVNAGAIYVLDTTLDARGAYLYRLNMDGTQYEAFGNAHPGTGRLSIGCGLCGSVTPDSLLLDSDGSIDVGGAADGAMTFWRVSSEGTDETMFVGAAPSPGKVDAAYGIAQQPDGSIVLAGGRGYTSGSTKGNGSFALERFTSGGQFDAGFGTDGIAQIQLGPSNDAAEWVAVEPDGSLLAVGNQGDGQAARIVAAHFTGDGGVDKSYGRGGVATVPGHGRANGGAALPDGRVYGFGADGAAAEVVRFAAPRSEVSFSPDNAAVGDVVRVMADGVGHGATVEIGGVVVPSADVDVVASNVLDVTVPSGAVPGKLAVVTSGGAVTSSGTLGILPTLDSPDRFVSVGDRLTLTGQGLAGTKSVTVGPVHWRYKIDSPTQLTVTVPTNAVKGAFTVTNAYGSITGPSSVAIIPEIRSFAPLSATAGKVVTITGVGLDSTCASIGGKWTTIVSATANRLQITVPPNAGLGRIDVCSDDGGSIAESSRDFRPLPSLEACLPQSDPTHERCVGTNLVDIQDVTLERSSIDFTPVDYGKFDATLPSDAIGGTWAVTTAAGTGKLSNWQVSPTVTAMSPDHAPTGAVVTVTGTGFANVSKVLIHPGTPNAVDLLVPFKVLSTTQLTFTVPVNAVSGLVVVWTRGGDVSGGRLTVAPSITSFTPLSGVSPSASMTITGTGLANVNAVTFDAGSDDAVTMNFVTATRTHVTLNVPAFAHSGPIAVSGPDGTATSSKPFQVIRAVYSITPENVYAGQTVTISGIGLAGVEGVRFDGVPAAVPVTSDADTTVTVVVPAGIRPAAEIWLDTAKTEFDTYLWVTNVTVQAAQQDTTYMELIGTGLVAVSTVEFTAAGGGFVSSDDVEGSLYLSKPAIRAAIPEGAVAGPVRVGDGQGHTALSSSSFPLIRVTSRSESTWAHGDAVTLIGVGFTGQNVYLNGEACRPTSRTDTSLTFTVPADATNGHLILRGSEGSDDLGEFDETAPPLAPSPDRVAEGTA